MSTKKNTAVATLGTLASTGQDGIPGMLEIVKKKIAEITKDSGEKESTKGKDLPGFGPINKIEKVSTLVQAHSAVVNREKCYNESAKILDVNTKKFPFKLEGCSANQWVTDIISRVSILVNKAELDKLKTTQKLLEDNLSQEAKLKNDLAKVAEMFSDDTPLE